MLDEIEGIELQCHGIAGSDKADIARGNVRLSLDRGTQRREIDQRVALLENRSDRQFCELQYDRVIGRLEPHQILMLERLGQLFTRRVARVPRR